MNNIEKNYPINQMPAKKNEMLNQNSEISEKCFEIVTGYNLEVFYSKEEMYTRMEQIRKENDNEAVGFVKYDSNKIGFYYKLGEKRTSVELDCKSDISWHSHPDIEISEAMLSEKDAILPDDLPEDIKRLKIEFFSICNEIDNPSPKKTSITDILTFISIRGKKDLISMPGGLLEVFPFESVQSGLLKNYVDRLDEYGKTLLAEGTEISLIAMYRMQIKYLYYAVSEFKLILEKLGYKKMTEENYLEILNKMGLRFEFHEVN